MVIDTALSVSSSSEAHDIDPSYAARDDMAVGNSHEENALFIALPSNSIMRSETPSFPLQDSSTGTQRPASVLGVGVGGAVDTFVWAGTEATGVAASLTSTFVSSLLGALQPASANNDPVANTATHLFAFIPVPHPIKLTCKMSLNYYSSMLLLFQ
jgi:hypothetical protein